MGTNLETAMETIGHDGDELVVGQFAVVVRVEYAEDQINDALVQFELGRAANSPDKLPFRYRHIGQDVETHGRHEIVQVVEEQEEGRELLHRDALQACLAARSLQPRPARAGFVLGRD